MALESVVAMRRAQSAYERARGKRAAVLALPLGLLSIMACWLGTRPMTAVASGAGMIAFAWYFLWRGQSLSRAVVPGVLAGLLPLSLAFAARSFGHMCTGAGCVSFCVPACTLGGFAAGFVIARVGRRASMPMGFFASSAALAAFVGALGCSCVGFGGIAGLVLGLVFSLAPLAIRRLA